MSSPRQHLQAMPSAPDIERFVLGSVMQDEKLMHNTRPVLEPEDFSLERHRTVWVIACQIYDSGEPVDRVSVGLALQNKGERDCFSFTLSLEEGVPVAPKISGYVRILKDKTAFRKIIYAGQSLVDAGFLAHGSPQTILDTIPSTLQTLAPQNRATGLLSAKEVMEKYGMEKLLAARKDSGLMFPWQWLNRWTSGMLPAELWILAGYTSTGKTSAMLQHAIEAARRGIGVAIFSLEVGDENLFQKAVYQISRLDSERGKRGKLNSDERRLLQRSANELCDLPIYFDTQSTTASAIHAAVRRRKTTNSVNHIIVDYLQLLGNSDRHETRAQAVGNNAWEMKMLAVDFHVPVLLLSQFSRKDKSKPDREPQLSDLKESGDIENHANGVWFLHRTNEMDSDSIPVKFMLPKQRDGRRDIYEDFYFNPRYQRFEQATKEEYEND